MEFGYLIDIQHFSVNDGDGIRTVIFFAGCPLRCAWCSNPEGFTTMKKVMHINKTCIECGRCTEICPHDVGMDLNRREERRQCTDCGRCVEACPTNSRQNKVFTRTVQEIVDGTSKYFKFFHKSNGGITYSGGECTSQIDFLSELVHEYYDLNINQAIETSGYFDFDKVKNVLKKMDMIFVDIKHMDRFKHKYFTGINNDLILENIKKLGKIHDNIIIRIPIIKGVNATEENINRTASFVYENIKNPRIELLPYHSLGDIKYESLNMRKPAINFLRPSDEWMDICKEIIEGKGVENIRFV